MNADPLLIGTDSVFPNQNASTAPTVWEEDTELAAQQGIPCGIGPMLTLTKRSTDQQFLPGGAFNPCAETAPFCLLVNNLRKKAGVEQRLSAALIAAGLVGAQFIGGIPGSQGLGVVGVGAPGDGVRGIAGGPAPTGHGVAGFTAATTPTQAGVFGEASLGGVGVLGQSVTGSGIGVHGRGSDQAVRGDGGSFGLVGRATSTGVDGTGVGAGSAGVVGRGNSVGVFGRGVGGGTFGVVGVGGTVGVRGDGRGDTSGIGVEGIPGPFDGVVFPWAGAFRGSVQVNGALFVNGDLFVSGAKSAVIDHPDGSLRTAYAVEAPESWLEDIGRARLQKGTVRVDVDRDFAALSGIGDDYHVFLTPEGPSNGLYVADRNPGGFEVREQGDGASDISFSYRIVTRRTDVRSVRLDAIERPTDAGERVHTERAEPAPSPSPARPDDPAPETRDVAFEAEPTEGMPAGWPRENVPWPPYIANDRSAE
jgi:hypothetical protein